MTLLIWKTENYSAFKKKVLVAERDAVLAVKLFRLSQGFITLKYYCSQQHQIMKLGQNVKFLMEMGNCINSH